MAHRDICIESDIEERRYETVGFLNEGETWEVNGYNALRRVPDAIGEEEYVFLRVKTHIDNFPSQPKGYWYLATARRDPDNSNPRVSCFTPAGGEKWIETWLNPPLLVAQTDSNPATLCINSRHLEPKSLGSFNPWPLISSRPCSQPRF